MNQDPHRRVDGVLSFHGGADSGKDPALLGDGFFAWGTNIAIRGGLPQTRPPYKLIAILPDGKLQGGSYYAYRNGAIVTSIDGAIYRLDISQDTASVLDITPASGPNNKNIEQAYFCQAVKHMIIQDGESTPIIHDGGNTFRAAANEVPVGTSTVYGNGRIWVARGEAVLAGDLFGVGADPLTNHLLFTETTYLATGGSFIFPDKVTGMQFMPRIDAVTDQGDLLVFTRTSTSMIKTTVFDRTLWDQTAGMQRIVFPTIGSVGQRGISSTDTDVYFRSVDGVRSVGMTMADINGSVAKTSLSTEARRIYDFDTRHWMELQSAVFFDNRLLMSGNPKVQRSQDFVGYSIVGDTIVSLDFAPITSFGRESAPAYDGEWTGIQVVQFITGQFDGATRCFALAVDCAGRNCLFEIKKTGYFDVTDARTRIASSVELPRMKFQTPYDLKELHKGELWFSDIVANFNWELSFKPDDYPCFVFWQDGSACALFEDDQATDGVLHNWNKGSYYVPSMKPVIECEDYLAKQTRMGYEFQPKISWVGYGKLRKSRFHANLKEIPDFGACT